MTTGILPARGRGGKLPAVLPVLVDGIPAELRKRPQWVVWRRERRKDELAKVPYSPRSLNPASSTDSATWGSWLLACRRLTNHPDRWDGLGFVFSPDDPYCGIDLDDCRDPATGVLTPLAVQAVDTFNSYAEVSPSGTGIKIIVKAKPALPRNRATPTVGASQVEVYVAARYFALTGHRLPLAPATIGGDPDKINDWIKEHLKKPERPTAKEKPRPQQRQPAVGHDTPELALTDRIRKSLRGAEFDALWAGDTSRYPSHSEADLALCNILAFWCGASGQQHVDNLFRQSGLMRAKWDEKHGDSSYGEQTIARAYEGRVDFWTPNDKGNEAPSTPKPLDIIGVCDLIEFHHTLRPAVIDNLLRRSEVANLVAPPKIGKTHLAHSLAIAVATGQPWLGKFRTSKGRVLLLDNELHPETLAKRLTMLADAMGVPLSALDGMVDVAPLRGQILDFGAIADGLSQVERDRYALVILDAKYKTLAPGAGESDTAAEIAWYSRADALADSLNAAFMAIHHTSKGEQTSKSVTDVGSGSGVQSRAADCHAVMRQHEDDGCVVLEAGVRSWPTPDPLVLRWQYPHWVPVDGADPTALRGKVPGRQAANDRDGTQKIVAALAKGATTARRLRDLVGMGPERLNKLLGILVAAGTVRTAGDDQKYYALVASGPP